MRASVEPCVRSPHLPTTEGCLYVPSDVRDRLLAWAQTSPVLGNLGIARTIDWLSAKYWWPILGHPDLRRYLLHLRTEQDTFPVANSTRCQFHNNPCPFSPWTLSQTSLSEGHTTILVVGDQFSKACRLIPPTGLHTALTAEALFSHIFWH